MKLTKVLCLAGAALLAVSAVASARDMRRVPTDSTGRVSRPTGSNPLEGDARGRMSLIRPNGAAMQAFDVLDSTGLTARVIEQKLQHLGERRVQVQALSLADELAADPVLREAVKAKLPGTAARRFQAEALQPSRDQK